MKILVVEDSFHLRENIQLGLLKSGFVVDSAEDGQVGLSFIESYEYDVILLDIMLPIINGFDLLNIIRERQINSAVIMLTAKDEINDRVRGLEMGADDYLCKPFAFKELVARINSVSRRNSLTEKVKIQFGALFFDLALKEIRTDESVINFTPTEYAIIEYLALNADSVITFEILEDRLRNSDNYMSRNALEVNISNIRRKIKTVGVDDFIKTKRSVGYYVQKSNTDVN